MEHSVIAGLDIGTTKVVAVIGEKNEYNEVVVLGVGSAVSHGTRKGMIVNIDSTSEAIMKAVEEAELMAGTEVDNIYTSITGSHVKGVNSRGVIAVSNKNKEINDKEIERVIDAAQTIKLSPDREILHVIPWEFIVDDQDNIKDPIGMTGVRFEVDAHIVTGSSTAIHNINRSIVKAGLKLNSIVLSSIASAEAILDEEEKEIGILLIDIGGGTTDTLLYYNGSTKYTNTFPVGGKNITKDIALGLKIPDNIAEKIKLEHKVNPLANEIQEKNNQIINENIITEDIIQIPPIGGREARSVPHSTLIKIIEARVEEILSLVYKDAKNKGILELIGGGIVLTGGSSLLDGIDIIAENIFNLPVRIGRPTPSIGLKDKIESPIFATATGLIIYGLKDDNVYEGQQNKNGLLKRMKNSIQDFTKDFFT